MNSPRPLKIQAEPTLLLEKQTGGCKHHDWPQTSAHQPFFATLCLQAHGYKSKRAPAYCRCMAPGMH
eukprot:scaffold134182_cov17-Tisochrysis_lutea.AAC.1